MRKFVIFSPPYCENNGGSVVLHKLCSELNHLGYQASLHWAFNVELVHKYSIWQPIYKSLSSARKTLFRRFKMNPAFNTGQIRMPKGGFGDDWIAVYPEIVLGNPLGARHIVRWFLHQPGFHKGSAQFCLNEVHVSYGDFARDLVFPSAYRLPSALTFMHYPIDHYNLNGALPEEARCGIAYCVRKGNHKPQIHHDASAILIDGKTHAEIASIFKRVKTFISYDSYTAYSRFAALCGADSIVVPDEGVDREGWYTDDNSRLGVAYGFSDINWARSTRAKLQDNVLLAEAEARTHISNFAESVQRHFNAGTQL